MHPGYDASRRLLADTACASGRHSFLYRTDVRPVCLDPQHHRTAVRGTVPVGGAYAVGWRCHALYPQRSAAGDKNADLAGGDEPEAVDSGADHCQLQRSCCAPGRKAAGEGTLNTKGDYANSVKRHDVSVYFDSNVDMREYNLIPGQAQALYDVMREWKIG